MPTLTTSYQYLGYSPENGPVIATAGKYNSKLYLRAKVESYNDNDATIRAEMLIRNTWMGWRASSTVIQLTGASTYKFVNSGSTVWTGAYGGGSGSGSKNYATMWSASTTFTVSYGTFNLGGKVTTGASYGATIANQSCTVNSPSRTLTYNANGGTNAPPAKSGAPGEVVQITDAIPLWADVLSNTFTVTFNANNGVVDSPSLISSIKDHHTFLNWNTAANGSGTTYNAGDNFTLNSNTILYAQWHRDLNRNSIKLPSGSRNGYVLKGYGRSTSDTILADDPYVPTESRTLYALWDPLTYKTSYKNGDSWTAAPVIKVKNSNGAWMPLGTNLKTTWGTSAISVNGVSYTINNGMTIGEFIESPYNTGHWFFRKWEGTWYIQTSETSTTITVLNWYSTSKTKLSKIVLSADQTYTTNVMNALPSTYSRLNYIKNSGTQYINTGFLVNYSTGWKIEISYAPDSTSKRGCLLSNYAGTKNCSYELNTSGKERIYINNGGADKASSGSYTTGLNTSSVMYSGTTITQTVNGTSNTTSYSITGACTDPLYIFVDKNARYSAFTNYWKLYNCKIYNGSTLVRNFMPSMRKSDCAIGVYDLVNGVFYPNAGTGTFLYGDFVDVY